MTKKKWLLILSAGLVIILGMLCLFWDTVSIYVMPKSVLSKAITEAMTGLQQRYEQSPVSVLGSHIDLNGQYTASLEMNTQHEMLGPVGYDMTVQTDLDTNRFSAEGTVTTAGNDLDLAVYLDRDFMGLSSDDLLAGAYYGITYDTFPEDIRSIPLLSMFVGDRVLSDWENSVSTIQAVVNNSYQLPQMPELSALDVQQAFMAVLMLPSRVERVELPVWGVYDQGHRISYSAKGAQVKEALGYLMDIGDGADAQIHASFYVYKNNLVMMDLTGEVGGNSIQCALEFMMETATTRTFRFSRTEQGSTQGFCLRHKAQRSNGYLDESWTFYPNFGAEGEGREIHYRWEPVMGELIVYTQPSITLHIFETEKGLNIQTDHFEHVLDAVTGKALDSKKSAISCNLILQKESQIVTPEYKNINNWSLQDLLVLINGVGSLFGLKIS